MKNFIYLISFFLPLISYCQCNFQWISNDTFYQDYIDLVYSDTITGKIITIGGRTDRGQLNDSIFSAPVFQLFDDCGILENKKVYEYIGPLKLKHRAPPNHIAYVNEPIGNASIRSNNGGFILVDKGVDSVLKNSALVIFRINNNGDLISYFSQPLDVNAANNYSIKNLLELGDGKLLVVLWDYGTGYFFYLFDGNGNLLLERTLDLGRGIRSIIEKENGNFLCTSLAFDNNSFQLYELDIFGTGEMKWITTPFSGYGSARHVFINSGKLYVIGTIEHEGVLLTMDTEGSVIDILKFNSFYCDQNFCNALIEIDGSILISGYVRHCDHSDQRGYDMALIKVDNQGSILGSKLFDIRSALNTPETQGYFNDYGGFDLVKGKNAEVFAIGISNYTNLYPGGIPQKDAILIKTDTNLLTATKVLDNAYHKIGLKSNLVKDHLILVGDLDLIEEWAIFSIQGQKIASGNAYPGYLILDFQGSGLYILKIKLDGDRSLHFFKFYKI